MIVWVEINAALAPCLRMVEQEGNHNLPPFDGVRDMAARLRKKQRIMLLVFGAVALAMSTMLVSLAMRDSIVFFFGPTELMAKEAEGGVGSDRRLRVGGMVVEGSVTRGSGEVVTFSVTDMKSQIDVAYEGILPDLFAEGQGVVAEGYFREGRFRAETVLAKHDEKYMPREVTDALDAAATLKE